MVYNTDAIIQYEPTSTNYENQINIPVTTLLAALAPLILEARQYLYAKGFTEQDIQDMLIEANGREEDLVPFVMTLTDIEQKQQESSNVVKSYLNFFTNTASAKELQGSDYVKCAMTAIGADFLWALGQSTAFAWTVATMKTAFKKVASKFLGPIGVAIAVVSFGVCIANEIYN
ncbi:hypothetical protein LL912_04740 [Niabella sp. CC-SYL272]|uniref:hypothetical protein n=1 Tax=Niabella agricola TaxID=2891571 RepID=UPI001F1A2FB9|nr:hypothetical protein [Niabella agricola]MCF3108077.1 hypothetical protein [Niabella agricola]